MTEEARSSKDVKLVEKSSSIKDLTTSCLHSLEEEVVPIPVIFNKDPPKSSGEIEYICRKVYTSRRCLARFPR